jgi:hypothetical protein
MRIALCISGETREYNTFLGPELFIEYLRSKGCTVDIYGHTWKHCEEPKQTNIIKFKELLIEDQSIIDRWVDENPNAHGWDTPRPVHMQADEWFGRLYHNTRVKTGQHIGGFTCLKMPEFNAYDLCIRWRWDLTLDLNHEWQESAMEHQFYPSLKWVSTRHDDAVCTTSAESHIANYGPCLNDTHIAFNKLAMHNLKNLNVNERIVKEWEGSKISYHTLWNQLLAYGCNMRIYTNLPNLTSFTSSTVHINDPIYN